MYESPIEIITTGVHLLVEENVYKTVTELGINVDKEELLRVLQYDREQYQKGYDDGCKEAIKEFWNRLQGIAYQSSDWSHGEHPMVVELDDVEEIYEEMVGEE
jgi:hypothetical protein